MEPMAADSPGAQTATRSTRVERALRVLASVGGLLLHADDEAGLLREVCRAIVDDGGYPMAFIGRGEPGGSVHILAGAGIDAAAQIGRAHV